MGTHTDEHQQSLKRTSRLCRRADWQTTLSQFLIEQAHTPFAYGRFDCCLFVADAVRVMTDTDLAAEFRGQYRTRREAYLLLKRHTGHVSVRAVAERAADQFGLPSLSVPSAQRGDMMLVKRGGDDSLGILHLNGREVVVPAPSGLWRIPLAEAHGAWRI